MGGTVVVHMKHVTRSRLIKLSAGRLACLTSTAWLPCCAGGHFAVWKLHCQETGNSSHSDIKCLLRKVPKACCCLLNSCHCVVTDCVLLLFQLCNVHPSLNSYMMSPQCINHFHKHAFCAALNKNKQAVFFACCVFSCASCRHGFLLAALNMPTGERWAYAIYLLHVLMHKHNILPFVAMYDINCRYVVTRL